MHPWSGRGNCKGWRKPYLPRFPFVTFKNNLIFNLFRGVVTRFAVQVTREIAFCIILLYIIILEKVTKYISKKHRICNVSIRINVMIVITGASCSHMYVL